MSEVFFIVISKFNLPPRFSDSPFYVHFKIWTVFRWISKIFDLLGQIVAIPCWTIVSLFCSGRFWQLWSITVANNMKLFQCHVEHFQNLTGANSNVNISDNWFQTKHSISWVILKDFNHRHYASIFVFPMVIIQHLIGNLAMRLISEQVDEIESKLNQCDLSFSLPCSLPSHYFPSSELFIS